MAIIGNLNPSAPRDVIDAEMRANNDMIERGRRLRAMHNRLAAKQRVEEKMSVMNLLSVDTDTK